MKKALLTLIAALWVVGLFAALWRPSLSVAAGGPFTVLTVGTPTGSCASGVNASAVCVNGSAVGGGSTPLAVFTPTITSNAATMQQTSSSAVELDKEKITLVSGGVTLTSIAAASMTTDKWFDIAVTQPSGTHSYAFTVAGGAGVTLDVSRVGGGQCAAPTSGSSTPANLDEAWWWDSASDTLSLEACTYTGTPQLFTDITQTISGATNIAATSKVTSGVLTFSASATVTIQAATNAGSYLALEICQNGTGGFTPTIAFSGVTLTDCTLPTFTTTLSKCGSMNLYFPTTSTAYCGGYAAGPL